jgi:hypothetical protein
LNKNILFSDLHLNILVYKYYYTFLWRKKMSEISENPVLINTADDQDERNEEQIVPKRKTVSGLIKMTKKYLDDREQTRKQDDDDISAMEQAFLDALNKTSENAEQVEEPEVKAKQVEEPEVKAKQVEEPEVKAKQVEEPEVKAKQVEEPEVKAEQVEEPEVKAKQVEEPEVKAKQVEEPEVKAKQVEAPSLSYLDLITNPYKFTNTKMTYNSSNNFDGTKKVSEHVEALRKDLLYGIYSASTERSIPKNVGTSIFTNYSQGLSPAERLGLGSSISTNNVKNSSEQNQKVFKSFSGSIFNKFKSTVQSASKKLSKIGKFFKEDVPCHIFGKSLQVKEMLGRNRALTALCCIGLGVVSSFAFNHHSNPHGLSNFINENVSGNIASNLPHAQTHSEFTNDMLNAQQHVGNVVANTGPVNTTPVSHNMITDNHVANAHGVNHPAHTASIHSNHVTSIDVHPSHKTVDGLHTLTTTDEKMVEQINHHLKQYNDANAVHPHIEHSHHLTTNELNDRELARIQDSKHLEVQHASTHSSGNFVQRTGNGIVHGADYVGNKISQGYTSVSQGVSQGYHSVYHGVRDFFVGNGQSNNFLHNSGYQNVTTNYNVQRTNNPFS